MNYSDEELARSYAITSAGLDMPADAAAKVNADAIEARAALAAEGTKRRAFVAKVRELAAQSVGARATPQQGELEYSKLLHDILAECEREEGGDRG